MSTLVEIESAVDRLSLAEQQELLHHLQSLICQHQNSHGATSREAWMKRLDLLRAAMGSGKSTLTTDQILDESRGD